MGINFGEYLEAMYFLYLSLESFSVYFRHKNKQNCNSLYCGCLFFEGDFEYTLEADEPPFSVLIRLVRGTIL